jgi:FtsP/CotA-like multicopper oxidase with cupredoxin domain
MNTPLTLLSLVALGLPAAAQTFDPPEALDLNPDPRIVEVNLVASEITWQYTPGVDTTVWAYNGALPGPTIRANVGDTLRVHFTNLLPEPTTIHWHGVELPAVQDGSHIAQRAIKPGESFDYEFTLLRDAFYWYHPHIKPFDQVEKGLYGGLIVHDPHLEEQLGLDEVEEHLVFFDDVLLDTAGQVVPAFSFADPLANALYHVNGREGNQLLVNGRAAASVPLDVQNGAPLRLRVVNAANTTFCRLDINDVLSGTPAQLFELGSDGGFLEQPYRRRPVTTFVSPAIDHSQQAQIPEMSEGILLFPGERMDVLYTPIGVDGQAFTIYQNDWFRGRHSAAYGPGGAIFLGDDPQDGLYPRQPFFDVVVHGADPGVGEYKPPTFLRKFPPPFDGVKGVLPVTFGHSNADPDSGAITNFVQAKMVNGVMTPLPTKKIDSFNAFDVEVGDVWEWKVNNLTHGDHPFHTHGFFFELLEYEWIDDLDPATHQTHRPRVRRIKDTIRIPARLGQKGTSRTFTRLAVKFDETGREGRTAAEGMTPTFEPDGTWTSGGWLFHCHILEHGSTGMLSVFEVHEPDEVYTLLGKRTPGTAGLAPSLTATGDLSAGEDITVELVDALANRTVFLVVGDRAARRVVTAGEIVPGITPGGALKPFLGVRTGVSSANGRFTWTLDDWDICPSGTQIYIQAAVRDPSALGRRALSNALTFTVP